MEDQTVDIPDLCRMCGRRIPNIQAAEACPFCRTPVKQGGDAVEEGGMSAGEGAAYADSDSEATDAVSESEIPVQEQIPVGNENPIPTPEGFSSERVQETPSEADDQFPQADVKLEPKGIESAGSNYEIEVEPAPVEGGVKLERSVLLETDINEPVPIELATPGEMRIEQIGCSIRIRWNPVEPIKRVGESAVEINRSVLKDVNINVLNSAGEELKYDIERCDDESGDFEYVGNTGSTLWMDDTVKCGSKYRYRVRAIQGTVDSRFRGSGELSFPHQYVIGLGVSEQLPINISKSMEFCEKNGGSVSAFHFKSETDAYGKKRLKISSSGDQTNGGDFIFITGTVVIELDDLFNYEVDYDEAPICKYNKTLKDLIFSIGSSDLKLKKGVEFDFNGRKWRVAEFERLSYRRTGRTPWGGSEYRRI